MFHLFNDTYLELDAAFTTLKYDNIAISSRWSQFDLYDPALKSVKVYESLDDFVEKRLNGQRDQFWANLHGTKPVSSRLVVYVDPQTYFQLQTEYWKSIFKNPTVEAIYELHKMYVEDTHFKSYFYDEYAHDEGRTAYRELTALSFDQFSEMYNSSQVSNFLRMMSKTSVSFEYQLTEYFRNSNSPYAAIVLDKIAKFTWTNWVQELEVLKADLINAAYDLNNVVPAEHQVDVSNATTLYASIANNYYLKWIIDPNVSYTDPLYVETTYDRNIFKHLYNRVLNIWIPEDQENAGEDMSVLIDLIYDHRYADLLSRDVARGLGCVYAAGRYRLRMNQLYLSWLYGRKRANDTAALAPYELA